MTTSYSNHTTLITGASAGIGTAFARELARRGSNLVLVARREDRLRELAAEIAEEHGVAVHTVPLDLSRPGAGRELKRETDRRGIRVTAVVNNAGFGTASRFGEEDPERLDDMIGVNIGSLVDISHAYIGDLRAHEAGFLLNVASTGGYFPIPGMAVYGATKAFVLSFTEALWRESRGSKLRVLALAPGATSSEFFEVVGAQTDGGTRHETPEQVVNTALRALEKRSPAPSVISGWRNKTLTIPVRLLSRRGVVNLVARLVG